jgi:hypothetical protein
MKQILFVAGSLGFVGLGLVTAAPASAAPSTDVGCTPAILCTIRDHPANFVNGIVGTPGRFVTGIAGTPERFVTGIAGTPERFVTGIAATPDRFLNGRDPADPTDGLLGTPTRFLTGLAATPTRVFEGVERVFGPVTAPEPE